MPLPTDGQPEPKKKFRIQRKRLGKVKFISEKGDYGFITAEDYRDDVFFHTSNWKPSSTHNEEQNETELIEGLWVEFELDDDQFEEDKRLRAKVVRPTTRPIGRNYQGETLHFRSLRITPKHVADDRHGEAKKNRSSPTSALHC